MAPGMSTTTSGAMGSQPILPPAGFQPEQPRSLLSYASKLDPIMVFIWAASTMLPTQWGFLAPLRYAAAAYFFLGLILFSRQVLPALGRAWPLLLLPILCVISALWAPSSSEALRKGISLGLTGIVAVYAATRLSGRNILIAYFFVELIAGVLSLIIRGQGQGALVGIYDSKNAFAIHMFILYATSLAVLLDKDNRPWLRAIAFVAIPTALYLVFMAKSGTTTLLVIGATAIMVGHSLVWKPLSRVPHGRMFFTVLTLVMVVLGAYIVIGILQIDIKEEVLAALGKDATLTSRTMLWEIAERVMQENPWTGLGANGYWRPENGMANTITNVIMGWDRYINFSFHNSYYENGVNFGYPGYFATAVLAAWICLSAALTWLRNQSVVNSAFLVLALMLVTRTFSEIDLSMEFSGTCVLMFIAASRAKKQGQSSVAPVLDYGRSIAARVKP
jgi:exopolysaccharide production protein ExoQ